MHFAVSIDIKGYDEKWPIAVPSADQTHGAMMKIDGKPFRSIWQDAGRTVRVSDQR